MWRKLLIAIVGVSLVAGAVMLWSGEQKHVPRETATTRFIAAEGQVAVKAGTKVRRAGSAPGGVEIAIAAALVENKSGVVTAWREPCFSSLIPVPRAKRVVQRNR